LLKLAENCSSIVAQAASEVNGTVRWASDLRRSTVHHGGGVVDGLVLAVDDVIAPTASRIR